MPLKADFWELYKEARYEDTLDLLLLESPEEEDEGEYAYLMGLCYTRLGEPDKAARHLEEASNIEENMLRLYQIRLLLGYVYNITQNYRSAEMILRRILRDGFESCQVYTALAHSLWHLGKQRECLKLLSRSLELDPENSNALNSMGYVMAEMGTNPQEAVAFCEKAVSLRPGTPSYLDSLGWALFRYGKAKEGMGYIEEALKGGADPIVCEEHLHRIRESVQT